MNLNKLFSGICLLLVIVNVGFFIRGIKLSDDINYFEKELRTYKQQNTEYEHQIYALESLSKTSSLAAELKYGKYNDPIFSDVTQYAYNK
jgi:hypothetical protein